MRHNDFMQRCLELGLQGRGETGANPMVGAVLVRDGNVIAEGFHEGFGNAHAERQLLEKFDPTSSAAGGLRGARQKISSKDILYVNLEPCCHENKKTPPCAQYLIEKGVKHVVYAMKDPNPSVSGKGIELLKKNGVEVIGSVLLAESLRLNKGFVSVQTKGRPWITLKSAKTSDGRIANDDGSPMRITSKEQDEWSHTFLRARHDAILVGVGTILADDPQLNVRAKGVSVAPWKIILDADLKTPLTAKIVSGDAAKKTIIVTQKSDASMEPFTKKGVRVFSVPLKNSSFDWNILWQKLVTPDGDFHGITSILVEGGRKTWDIFKSHKLVDEEIELIG